MPFTASIIERSFAFVPDRILKLGGASWLRPLSGGLGVWERIRLGVLCAVTPNGTGNITDAVFMLGLCAGQTNPGSAYYTDNFLGATLNGGLTVVTANRTLTYNANAGNPYFQATAGFGIHKVGTLYQEATAAFSSGIYLPLAAYIPVGDARTNFRRGIVIVDIARTASGNGAVILSVYATVTAASIAQDLRPDHLWQALDQPGLPSVRGAVFTAVLNASTALNYSALPSGLDVDTFEIFWSKNTFPLEISALGATIIRPLIYTSLGDADETFEEYAVSSGSIAVSGALTGGVGWSAAGSIEYTRYNAGTLSNSSNLAAQVFTQYVGTTNCPNEPFEQYSTGTVDSGTTINLGSYWTGAGVIEANRSSNFIPQVFTQYVGTTFSPDEPFEQYSTGTVDSGTTINLGSYWTAFAYIEPSVVNTFAQVFVQLAGTNVGTPYDTFADYVVNNGSDNGTTATFTAGSFWATTGTVFSVAAFSYVGTTGPNPFPLSGIQALAGTSVGFPFDTFQFYGTGTIVSGVTLNAGSYWSSNGSIY